MRDILISSITTIAPPVRFRVTASAARRCWSARYSSQEKDPRVTLQETAIRQRPTDHPSRSVRRCLIAVSWSGLLYPGIFFLTAIALTHRKIFGFAQSGIFRTAVKSSLIEATEEIWASQIDITRLKTMRCLTILVSPPCLLYGSVAESLHDYRKLRRQRFMMASDGSLVLEAGVS